MERETFEQENFRRNIECGHYTYESCTNPIPTWFYPVTDSNLCFLLRLTMSIPGAIFLSKYYNRVNSFSYFSEGDINANPRHTTTPVQSTVHFSGQPFYVNSDIQRQEGRYGKFRVFQRDDGLEQIGIKNSRIQISSNSTLEQTLDGINMYNQRPEDDTLGPILRDFILNAFFYPREHIGFYLRPSRKIDNNFKSYVSMHYYDGYMTCEEYLRKFIYVPGIISKVHYCQYLALARFYNFGLFHDDVHDKNILIKNNEDFTEFTCYLIDFGRLSIKNNLGSFDFNNLTFDGPNSYEEFKNYYTKIIGSCFFAELKNVDQNNVPLQVGLIGGPGVHVKFKNLPPYVDLTTIPQLFQYQPSLHYTETLTELPEGLGRFLSGSPAFDTSSDSLESILDPRHNQVSLPHSSPQSSSSDDCIWESDFERIEPFDFELIEKPVLSPPPAPYNCFGPGYYDL